MEGEGSPPYLAGGGSWAAHPPGAHLPAWGTGPGACHSLVFAAIPPSPAAWPSAGRPAGETWRGHGRAVRQRGGRGAAPTSVGHGLYLILHQPIAGGTLLAAGARRVGKEVGLAPVALVAHEAGAAEAGAVLVALRGDGAQWGAVAGCNGGRKVSRRGCQPRFWDRGAVPILVTSAAPG